MSWCAAWRPVPPSRRPFSQREAEGARGPLSSSQSGLWFIEQYEEASHLYNMPVYFRVKESWTRRRWSLPSTTCLPATPACAPASSRMRRAGGPGDPAPCSFKLQIEDVSAEPQPSASLCGQTGAGRDRAPLLPDPGDLSRCTLFGWAAASTLLITQHHIISDGWSVKNMFADLKRAFLAHQNREPAGERAAAHLHRLCPLVQLTAFSRLSRRVQAVLGRLARWQPRGARSAARQAAPGPSGQRRRAGLSTIESDLWESFAPLPSGTAPPTSSVCTPCLPC